MNPNKKTMQPDGLIIPQDQTIHFDLRHHEPAPALAHVVERYWSVHWSLDGDQHYQQNTVPPPCFNFAFWSHRASMAGVIPKRFEMTLSGTGSVFGVKLKPGAFHVFSSRSADAFLGEVLLLSELFGDQFEPLHQEICEHADIKHRVDACDHHLTQMIQPPHKDYALICEAIHVILTQEHLMTVQALAEHLEIKPRSLQRLFKKFVGVSPKWVICRDRIQTAIDVLSTGEKPDWATLAIDLGYYDQSHFINDFKSLVGTTPEHYTRQHTSQSRGAPTE